MRIRTILVVISLFLTLLLSGGAGAGDDEDKPFTIASLNGTYGGIFIGSGGSAPASGISVLIFDGAGYLSGRSVWNKPDGFGGQTVAEFPIDGTYVVDPDGMARVLPTPGGPERRLRGSDLSSRNPRRWTGSEWR
jgi:hypothetical protein